MMAESGAFGACEEWAREGCRSGDGRRAVVPLVDFWVGLSYLLDGRIALALDQLRTVFEVGQQFAGTDSGTSGLVYGSLLEALYQSDRIDEARELLDQQI